jgi:carbon monoxide dehydrogenase subunit G
MRSPGNDTGKDSMQACDILSHRAIPERRAPSQRISPACCRREFADSVPSAGGLFFGAPVLYLGRVFGVTPKEAPMAMTMTGEVQLPATRQAVWDKLNDPEVLKACIPGCEELEKTDENGFRATAKMKVGPVSARFKGKVTLSDLDPPNGYRISGEGEGGVAGFAKGGATVALAEKDGGTLLSYNVEAQIGGKLAQLGQRLINGAAKKLADEFFANFAKAVQG